MPSLLRNAVAMLAARLAAPVFSFAINVAVARVYGADVLGVYVYLLSLLLVFQAVAGAGMSLLVTREIAARPQDGLALLRQGRTIGLASGIVATLAFLVVARLGADGDAALAALALAPSLLPSAWIAAQEADFVARRRHHAVTVVALAENATKVVLAGVAFATGAGLLGVCVAITAARVAALAAGQLLLRREEEGRSGAWRLDAREALPLARALPPFAAMLVLAMLFFRVDVLVLGWLRGGADTGLYGAALTLYSIALLVPDSAMSAVYPRLAASFRHRASGAAQATLLTAKLLAVALVPASVALALLAEPILGLIYGGRFAGAAPALRLLAASLPVHAVNAALGQALQAGGHQREMLGVACVGTALHVAITAVLVLWLGMIGAPLAVLASSSLVAVLSARLFHRRVARIDLGARSAVAASAVVVPVALAVLAPPPLAAPAAVTGATWLAVVLLARQVVARGEIAEMARAFRPAQAEEAGA